MAVTHCSYHPITQAPPQLETWSTPVLGEDGLVEVPLNLREPVVEHDFGLLRQLGADEALAAPQEVGGEEGLEAV